MPRVARPRWDFARAQWCANVGAFAADGKARTVYAPRELVRRDEAGAWDWFRAELARRDAETVPALAGDVLVRGLCEHYLGWAQGRRDEGRLSPEHYESKTYHLTHFCNALGERASVGLVADDVTKFLAGLATRYSPNYVASIGSTVSAVFNWAVKAKRLVLNPVAGYETPRVPRSPERFAERSEAAAFLRFWWSRSDRRGGRGRVGRLTALLVRCLIHTGARPGELCKLWWSDLRWAGGSTSAGHSFAKAVIPPFRWKSGAATGKPRTIYFSPSLSRALAREYQRADRHAVNVFFHGWGRGGVGAREPWESGSRLSKRILIVRREAVARCGELRAAGRPLLGLEKISDSGANRVVNYRWRHTAISTLLMMSVDVPTVAELTGTSPQMIYQVYGHLLDSHLSAAAEKLGAGRRL